MANALGFNLGNVYRDVETLKTAKLRREGMDRDMKREENALKLRKRVAGGDRSAMMELAAIDPQGARSLQSMFDAADAKQIAAVQQDLEEIGQAAMVIQNSRDPASTYQQIRSSLPPEVQARMPEQYNENWINLQLVRTMAADEYISMMDRRQATEDTETVLGGGSGGSDETGPAMTQENALATYGGPTRTAAAASGKRPNWITYSNQNATRDKAISPQLEASMSFLPEMGVTMEVFSGGQDPKGSGGKRTGSTRHDHGHAADVFFYKDGRKLSWENESDIPILQEIVRRGKANGLTGFGAGDGYMQPGSMHIGFGDAAVWGAGGKGKNAPAWLRAAYSGQKQGPKPPVKDAARVLNNPESPDAVKDYVLAQFADPEADETAMQKNIKFFMDEMGLSRMKAVKAATGRDLDVDAPEPLEPSVSNAIWRQSAALYGGLYDPNTGNITGLKGTEMKVNEVAAEAERIVLEDGASVAQAVRKANRILKDSEGTAGPTTPELPEGFELDQ